jgi:preprotein translocase subunit SecB
MAAEPNGVATPGPAEKPASFKILAQYVKDMSFENPNAPAIFQAVGQRPKLKIDANVAARKVGDNVFESALKFEATANAPDERVLYHLEIDYAGLFQMDGIPEQAIQPMLLINCPTLIYPFLRRIVADVTREGGYPPLLLDPIDFHALYMRNTGKTAGQPPKAAASA